MILDPLVDLSLSQTQDVLSGVGRSLAAADMQEIQAAGSLVQILLIACGIAQLETLSYRELITFHDGFAYLADSFDLTILEAVEEESGSEASAAELIHLITEVRHHNLPAVFTEELGSVSAAGIIAAETGVDVYTLDMAMHGDGYLDAMYKNIDTLKGALG